MKVNEIIALANAGFTAQQIATIAEEQTKQAKTDLNTVYGMNAQQIPAQQIPAQQIPAQQIPAQQIPAQRIPEQQTGIDALMGEIRGLRTAVQANAILQSNVNRDTVTTDDVLAEIINPKEVKGE